MKKIKNIVSKIVNIFKKNQIKIEYKEIEENNIDIKELPLKILASIVEEEYNRTISREREEETKKSMMEFCQRVNTTMTKFVNLCHDNPEYTKKLSVREFHKELAISLAIQSFVKTVNYSFFEVDQLSDTAMIGLEISPSNELLKDIEPMFIKLNVEGASNTFGKGFMGEGNPFYEGK